MPSRSPATLAALAVATAVAAATAACSSPRSPAPAQSTDTSGPTTTASAPTTGASTSTTAAGPGSTSGLQAGTYTDGPAGMPHYVVDVTSSTGPSVAGSISFVYQDGRTASVASFTGTAGAGRATLALSPQGTQAAATYTSTTLVLDGCTGYLQYATSAAQCTFAFTGTSPG